MRFVYPYFLWLLLLLVIPIIIHLYNFRKYKTLYFSSITFLKKVDLETQATKNLKHLLVLISRLLCLLFAILAFAQPYIPVSSQTAEGGNPLLAIYLDNSFSMGQKGTEGELISEARECAKRIIKEASSDTRFLLVTNEMSGIEQRIISQSEALDQIDKIELSPMVRKLGDVMAWERNFVEQYRTEKEKISTVQYVILSDFQKTSFDTKAIHEDASSFYYPIQFVPQNSSNLAVDSVWFTEPNSKIGQNNELNIRIQNYGEKDKVNAELHVEAGAVKRDIFADIPANSSKITTVNFLESKTAKQVDTYRSASASIRDNQVFFDDEFFFSYAPKESANVLIIDGPDASPNVQLVYGLDKFYKSTTVSQNAVTLDQFEEKDLVVVNGANEMASGFVQMLKDFKNNQGNLLLFPGTDLNKSSWNSALSALNLPALGSIITEGSKIRDIAYNDLFFKPVFDKKPDQLNLPALYKMYATSTSSQTVALLKAQNGMSVFLRSVDTKAYLFTSSLKNEFSSFTNHALFTTLLLRVGELSHKQRPYYLTIGEDSKYPLYYSSNGEKPIHLKNETVDFIPIKERIGNLDYLSIRGNEANERLSAGIYDIIDQTKIGKLALNYARIESNCNALNVDLVVEEFENSGLKNIVPSEIKEGQSLAKLDLEKPFEYWRWAILLSLLFLIVELVLIRWWKN
ncbi:MAG: BatA domain-containing protein [Crocinitomicaceae bacterium]